MVVCVAQRYDGAGCSFSSRQMRFWHSWSRKFGCGHGEKTAMRHAIHTMLHFDSLPQMQTFEFLDWLKWNRDVYPVDEKWTEHTLDTHITNGQYIERYSDFQCWARKNYIEKSLKVSRPFSSSLHISTTSCSALRRSHASELCNRWKWVMLYIYIFVSMWQKLYAFRWCAYVRILYISLLYHSIEEKEGGFTCAQYVLIGFSRLAALIAPDFYPLRVESYIHSVQ